jgi:hypothetical protein
MSTSSPPFDETKLAEAHATVERPESKTSFPNYSYEGHIVTANEWVKENITNDLWGKIRRYFIGLFPIFSWIYRYNFTWGTGGECYSWKLG